MVLGTEPSGTIPYSESVTNSTAIIGNWEPSAVTFEWSLYVAKCIDIYLYAVTPNAAKGGITPAKICTCGQETITALSSRTLELLYQRSDPTSYQEATQTQLHGLFAVDTTATIATCGIVSISLTSDTNGTAFTSDYSNYYITLNSDNSLIIPTSRELSSLSFYVRAVTNGNKVAYK